MKVVGGKQGMLKPKENIKINREKMKDRVMLKIKILKNLRFVLIQILIIYT